MAEVTYSAASVQQCLYTQLNFMFICFLTIRKSSNTRYEYSMTQVTKREKE